MNNANTKPLRIAQVTNLNESIPPQNKGGLEQMVYYLTEELVSMGHDVTLFGTADSKTSAKLVPLWPTAISMDDHLPLKDMQTSSIWSISEVFRAANKFDIIHDHTYFIAGHFAKLIDTPVISTVHHPIANEAGFVDSFPKKYQPFLQKQLAHSNDITSVVVSQFQQKELSAKLMRESYVIHNGIPTTEWQNPNVGTKGSYIAFLGYMSGNKGVSEAIQAVLKTNETLKIAGPIDTHDKQTQTYFDTQVKPFIDNKKIQYLGGIDRKEKIGFLRNAKAILMPIQWDEPFGLVAIESLAMGTPVIAFSRGALPEIVENGVSGYLVTSIEEMAAKIKIIDKLSREDARLRFEQNFTAKRMAEQYVEIYNKLISKEQKTA